MTDTTTQAVTALLDGVTPGPWHFDGQAWNLIVWSSNENRVCFMAHSNGLDDDRDFATAAFIAAARDLVPALLAERDALAHDIARHVAVAADLATDCEDLRAQLAAAEARARESALDALAAYGQAAEAHEAQLAAEAMLTRAYEAGRDDAAGAAEKRYDQCERVVGPCQLRKCAIARFLRDLPVPSPADLADRVKGGGV